jgi:hypothetical protein
MSAASAGADASGGNDVPISVADARERVRRHLDDQGTTAPRFADAEIDQEISTALSATVEEYARAGGERFDVETLVTTTSAGIADLSDIDIIDIRCVSIDTGAGLVPLEPGDRASRRQVATGVRDLSAVVVLRPALPDDDEDPLLEGAWPDIEALIVARAALYLCPKSIETRVQRLELVIADLKDTVMRHARVPRSYELRDRVRARVSWVWMPVAKEIHLYIGGR